MLPRYRIKAGDYHLVKKEGSEQEVSIEKVFVHHGYSKETYESDIALVKLKQPVELGDFVRTVCLPKSEEGDLAIQRNMVLHLDGVRQNLPKGREITTTRKFLNIPRSKYNRTDCV